MKTENIIQELETILTKGNVKNAFNSSFYKWTIELSDNERELIYRHFLNNNQHQEHEEIAGAFQIFFHEKSENVNILLEAIYNVPNYLTNPTLKYSYIRKCIYAIGAQPNPSNIIALETLSENQDTEIAKLAMHQLSKRKELGRWESIKRKNK